MRDARVDLRWVGSHGDFDVPRGLSIDRLGLSARYGDSDATCTRPEIRGQVMGLVQSGAHAKHLAAMSEVTGHQLDQK
jgi:hypothetical protein